MSQVTGYRRSAALILLAAITPPIWNVILVPLPAVSLTFGRGLVVLSTLFLFLDYRRTAEPRPAVPHAVRLLLAALTLLWAWTVVNAVTWGCRCVGEIAGFSELVAVAVLAALVAAFEPRLRSAMVLAVVAGASLSAALTLAGVQGLTAGSTNTSTFSGRFAGPYGNPNLLAFALAFAVPAGLAAYRLFAARTRLLLAGALGLVGLVLLLTFSRGGLLAAVAGSVVVLVLQHPRRSRARRQTVLAVAAVLAMGGVAYPVFAELRRDISSAGLDAALRAQDLSGWDAGTQGLISSGPAKLVNSSRDQLEVRVDRAGQGVSRRIGPAAVDGAYELSFEARVVTGADRLDFGLEDNLRGNGPSIGSAPVSEQWQKLRIRWTPTDDSPDARLYVWSGVTAADFRIRNVLIVARGPGGSPIRTAIPVRLRGSAYLQREATRRKVEAREIASRRVGVELSVTAFASQPVRGIGWGRFNDVAATRSEFGRLPTHNEYLRFLAELGAVGVLLLGLVALTIGFAVRRAQRDEIGLALVGMLVTGGVGLLFVNGLATPMVTMPLAFAAAAACARSGLRSPAISSEAAGWWPSYFGPRPQTGSEWVLARSWGQTMLRMLRDAAPVPASVSLVRAWDQGRLVRLERVANRWEGSRTAWALGIGALALMVRIPLMFEHHQIDPGGDSQQYVSLAQNFLAQDQTSVTRPPGYPLFLALVGTLPGRLEDGAVITQLIIGSGLCAGMVFVAWPLFGRVAAGTAGLLAGLTPPLLSLESLILADYLFGALVSVAAALLISATLSERGRTATLIATGLVVALSVYVKPVGQALVLAPLLPLALATRSVRATCMGTGIVLVTVAMATVPWMVRNEVKYGSFTMSAQSGITLFNRVFEDDRLPIPTDLPAGRIAEDFRLAHPDTRLSSGVFTELVRRGASASEAEAMQREMALTAARRSPLEFAEGTLLSTRRVFTDVASGEFVTNGSPIPRLTAVGLSVVEPLRRVWGFLALFGFASALWFFSRGRRTQLAAGALFGVWGSVAVATAILHGGQLRYSAALAPITWLLGSAGLVVAAKASVHVLALGATQPRPRLLTLLRAAATPTFGPTEPVFDRVPRGLAGIGAPAGHRRPARVMRELGLSLVRKARDGAPALRMLPTFSTARLARVTHLVRAAPLPAVDGLDWPSTRFTRPLAHPTRRERFRFAGTAGRGASGFRAAPGVVLVAFRALRGAGPGPGRVALSGSGLRGAPAPAIDRARWPLAGFSRPPNQLTRRERFRFAGAISGLAARFRAAPGVVLVVLRALRGAAPGPERLTLTFRPVASSGAPAPAIDRARWPLSGSRWPLVRGVRRVRRGVAGTAERGAMLLRVALRVALRVVLVAFHAFRALRAAAPDPERLTPDSEWAPVVVAREAGTARMRAATVVSPAVGFLVARSGRAAPTVEQLPWPLRRSSGRLLTRSAERIHNGLAGASAGVVMGLRAASGRIVLACQALRNAAPPPERCQPNPAEVALVARLRNGAPGLFSVVEPDGGARLAASFQRHDRRSTPPLNSLIWDEIDLFSEVRSGPSPGAPPELPMAHVDALRAAAPTAEVSRAASKLKR